MPNLSIHQGATSKIVRLFIKDSSVTTGAGKTGLAFNTASLTAYYIKEGDTSTTAITLVTTTVGVWVSGGFVEVDATNAPGLYELSLPNAAIASGKALTVCLKGATNMTETVLEYQLTAFDDQNAASHGLTAVPVNLAQAVSVSPTAGTVGAAFAASIAGAIGKFVISGTPGNAGATGILYASDGTTALKTFDLSTAGSRV